jgi:hypothetical protein
MYKTRDEGEEVEYKRLVTLAGRYLPPLPI